MFTVKTYNKIADEGLSLLPEDQFSISDELDHADCVLLRSQKLHDVSFPASLKAIGRAGAGVNNIPVDTCSDQGIVVFNTPGANANAVKELVIGSLITASRNMIEGVSYVESISGEGDEIPQLVEANKMNYKGTEVAGKKLGVIGLGAIGMMVANDAVSIGMDVQGFDPFISIQNAWQLSRSVQQADNVDRLLGSSDYITLHMPFTEKTAKFINAERLRSVRRGAKLFNFARPEIVDIEAVKEALLEGRLSGYITDFPSKELVGVPGVLAIPHLGASTQEAETNCSVMVARQVKDFLMNGNIRNSVNFPTCVADRAGDARVLVSNRNIPQMVSQITSVLADAKLNILELINKSRGDLAYNIVDVEGQVDDSLEDIIRAIDGVIRVRILR